MPLLMCPNDDTAMQMLERSGVQFDMCPTCRGVWLDRGELEKLMEGTAANGQATPRASAPPQNPSPNAPWGGSDAGYRDDRYRDDDRGHHRKKKRDSIFDIFD